MGAIFVAIILGVVQGLTEFIPVSSSAHLRIVPFLFGWKTVDGYTFGDSFDFSIHLGTLAALLIYFRNDWIRLIRSLYEFVRALFGGQRAGSRTPTTRSINYAARVRGEAAVAVQNAPTAENGEYEFGSAAADCRFLLFLVVATIPGAIAGFLFEKKINGFLDDHEKQGFALIAITLSALGVLLMLAERFGRKQAGLEKMNWLNAIIIGIAQAFSVVPGFSRSGSTITAGLILGYTREAAARFSFLLSTPLVLGAGIKSAIDLRNSTENASTNTNPTIVFIVGVLTAAVVGYIVIGALLRFLQRQPTYIFTVWRIVVAAIVLITLVLR